MVSNSFLGKSVFLVASSGYVTKKSLFLARNRLFSLGVREVFSSSDVLSRFYDYAGEGLRKANELNLAYSSSADYIFNIIGGMGAIQAVSSLDFDLIKKSGKILVGFSDLTLILNAIYQKTGVSCVHGPHFGKNVPPSKESIESLFSVLNGEGYSRNYRPQDVFVPGTVSGTLVGGNVELLGRSLGTAYEIDTDDKVLFLEDFDMKAWRVYDILWQLKLSGKFDNVRGIILGYFNKFEGNIGCYIRDFFKGFSCPVILNQPIGHDEPNLSVPIGGSCSIDTDRLTWTVNPS